MRRTSMCIAAIAAVACAAVYGADLPDALQHLETLADDEQALVDSVRGFDRLQCELAAWDMELAEELAMQGERELAQEQAEKARQRLALVDQAYGFVLARYPDNPRAMTYYGELIYDYQGDHAKAIMLWRKAVAFNPRLSKALNNLAIHYSHTGEVSRGLDYFDRALEVEPDNPDYLYNLCQIYLTRFPEVAKRQKWSLDRVYRTAMKMSKKAAELSNEYELIQDYAVNYFAAENFGVKADWRSAARAWQWARTEARTANEEFFTWLNEARAWLAHGHSRNARECLEAALRIRPDSDVAARLLSEL